ncbi:alpha/beta hydrolase fold domain-containing protein [Streptomyces sp. NPDC048272]|uniref:alpha/beta hydrolase fold domain-containing protein n=1 Tax=Streptomyces sp. NPDC048272 TaxID=3154616 RepID=UPI003443F0E5
MKPLPTLPLPLARVLLHPGFRLAFHHRLPFPAQRALLNGLARLQPLPPGTSVRALHLGGRPAERITVGPTSGAGAVLYLHGGGHTVGSPATHRSLAAHLAREIRRPVYLPDYRLAPEHPCPASTRDALAAFEALTTLEGHAPDTVVLAGDSAGGAIALATAQLLAADRERLPSALVLVSPWTNPNLVADRSRDLVINRRWALSCAAAYLGAGDPADARYAPLLGPMAGLPPTYLHTNTRELLYSQCLDLAVALRRADVPLRYAESAVLWHAAQAQAGLVAEAAASLRDIGDFLTANWSRGRAEAAAAADRDGARSS